MKKEKILTFKNYRFSWCLKKGNTAKKFRKTVIEKELDRGYVPKGVEVEERRVNAINSYGLPYNDYSIIGKPKDILIAFCMSAYAGKKSAKEIVKNNPEIMEKEEITSILLPIPTKL